MTEIRDEGEADATEPVISLLWDRAEDGTYFAEMRVSGLKSERHVGAALEHMQRLFCGKQQTTND